MDKPQDSRTKKLSFYNKLRLPLIGREMLDAEEALKQCGFHRSSSVVELAAVVVFLMLVSIVISVVVWLFKFTPVPWSQAFTAVLSLGVAIIAYRQWRAARHEISIDKYYDRLETANKRLEALETDKPTAEDMHAFAELDKLEYVIVKYEHGYISPVLALRALMNFHGLCKDRRGFSQKAAFWVDAASYRAITRRVVRAVCEKCQASSNAT